MLDLDLPPDVGSPATVPDALRTLALTLRLGWLRSKTVR
jgi:hypothetical protein